MNILNKLLNSVAYSPEGAVGTDPGKPGVTPPPQATTLNGKDPPAEGGGDGKDVWTGLVKDPDNLEYVKTKGWQDPDETVKSYRELESSKSKLKLPDEKSTPEERDAFFNALGRPEKPEGYEFKLPEKIPETFPYEEETANEFKGISHKARLTAEQAQVLHDWYVEKQAGSFDGTIKDTARRIETAHDTIVKDFGDPKGSEYGRKIELADRSVRELGKLVNKQDPKALRNELIEIGALLPDGKVMAPFTIMALSRIGETLYSEDKVYSGIASSHNPWKPETESLTLQGKIIKEDPEAARQLILAANLDPKTFGL